jgi:replication factor C subunit 1
MFSGDANQKSGMHTPFTLFSELIGPYMFSHTSRKTINDKTDYYFQDPSLVPLLMHENYIKQKPSACSRDSGMEKDMHALSLFSKASESISDGDVIDSMIHG